MRRFEEIAQHLMPVFRGDGFRMELNALNRQIAVLQPHDRSILKPGGDFKTGGQTGTLDDQRMIARRLKGRWQAMEEAAALMMHGTHLAMDDLLAAHDLATKRLTNGLMAKTYTQ